MYITQRRRRQCAVQCSKNFRKNASIGIKEKCPEQRQTCVRNCFYIIRRNTIVGLGHLIGYGKYLRCRNLFLFLDINDKATKDALASDSDVDVSYFAKQSLQCYN